VEWTVLTLVGGVMCSEVAVDPYTTKILKADVTLIDYGVLGGVCCSIQSGIWQRETPDVCEQGFPIICRDGTWVGIRDNTNDMGGCAVFHLLIEKPPP
jgi:hypothetical protein